MGAQAGIWRSEPPPAPPAIAGCLAEPGSLTDRLVATGRRFTVTPLFLGADIAHPDEAVPLALAAGAPVFARHVALALDGTVVVVARSLCPADCPVWPPILDRGGRSLGLTLFAPGSSVARGALAFATLRAGHPLYALAAGAAGLTGTVPARRCRFVRDGAALTVAEAFLPVLETVLAP